jgi:hypothetical protein
VLAEALGVPTAHCGATDGEPQGGADDRKEENDERSVACGHAELLRERLDGRLRR